jgi:hypothetical protein
VCDILIINKYIYILNGIPQLLGNFRSYHQKHKLHKLMSVFKCGTNIFEVLRVSYKAFKAWVLAVESHYPQMHYWNKFQDEAYTVHYVVMPRVHFRKSSSTSLKIIFNENVHTRSLSMCEKLAAYQLQNLLQNQINLPNFMLSIIYFIANKQ